MVGVHFAAKNLMTYGRKPIIFGRILWMAGITWITALFYATFAMVMFIMKAIFNLASSHLKAISGISKAAPSRAAVTVPSFDFVLHVSPEQIADLEGFAGLRLLFGRTSID